MVAEEGVLAPVFVVREVAGKDLRRFEPLVGEGCGNTHWMPFLRHRSHELPSFRSDVLFSPRHFSW